MARGQRARGGRSAGGNRQPLLPRSTVPVSNDHSSDLLHVQILSWSPQTQAGETNGLAFLWRPRSPGGQVSDVITYRSRVDTVGRQPWGGVRPEGEGRTLTQRDL